MMIGSGVLIIIFLVLYLILQPGQNTRDFDIASAPINYDQPLHAIHEMDEPGQPKKAIPFLPKDGPQPMILIPVTSYDFGQVGATEVVTHDFVIANIGEAPLTISRAYTSCGCTTADFTSTVIPPGEKAMVTIRFDAGFHDVRGQVVRRYLVIESNDPANSELRIYIQAAVQPS